MDLKRIATEAILEDATWKSEVDFDVHSQESLKGALDSLAQEATEDEKPIGYHKDGTPCFAHKKCRKGGVVTYSNDGAKVKLLKWHEGVTPSSVRKAIGDYIYKGLFNGNIKAKDFNEALNIAYAAARFFDEYSNKTISLSDGRCAYFAPDENNKKRGYDNNECWAIYCVHAVTHGGKMVRGKSWPERIWSPEKVANMLLIDKTLKEETCRATRDQNRPDRDRILFIGKDVAGNEMTVVTHLDEYGNVAADLTEVTVVMGTAPTHEEDSPIRSLKEAAEVVAKHQLDNMDRIKSPPTA